MGVVELPVIYWQGGREGGREGGEEEAAGYVRLDIEAGEEGVSREGGGEGGREGGKEG